MPTLKAMIEARIASGVSNESGAVGRLSFWCDALGDREIDAITPEDVDTVMVQLAERGRLKPRRGQAAEPARQPLKGSTLNRYLATLGSVFLHAKRMRVLPRAYVSPTRGLERASEPVDPDRYLRPEEVERLITVARVVDNRWRKLPALIQMAFHTGLRVGNLTELKWSDVDLKVRTARVPCTKNGQPIVAALTASCVAELKALPGKHPEALVFSGRYHTRAHSWRRLWHRTCDEAGLPGRNFHQLRHGCGSALATAGVGQAQIMAVMGHRTLTASARYMHSNVDDRRAVVDKVFG